jgi:hypothetical protein
VAWTVPKFWNENASSEPGLWLGNGKVQPGALSGEPTITLAGSGNVVACTVHPFEMMGSTFSPPGSSWTAQRTTGAKPRRVDIRWRVAIDSTFDGGGNLIFDSLEGLLWVSARIDWLIQAQSDRTLLVSDGRSSAVRIYDGGGNLVDTNPGGAILLPSSGPVTRRYRTPGGTAIQTWLLHFLVLNPAGLQRVDFDGGDTGAGCSTETGNVGAQGPREPT